MWARAAAGAVLLLAVTGCRSDHADAPPAPTSSHTVAASSADTFAVGPPARIPWWSAGELHLPGRVVRTPVRHIVARGGTTLLGQTTPHGSHWTIVRGDELTELMSTRTVGVRPVLSANGAYAAWATYAITHRYDDFDAEAAFTVTAYDVRRATVTGSTVIDSRAVCCDGGGAIEVAGVDADGTVVIVRYADRAWVWDPGHDPVQISDRVRPDRLPGNDEWPGGISWTTTGDSSAPATFGSVTDSGAVTPLGRVPQSQGGIWSPDGRSYAYLPFVEAGGVRAVVWREGRRRQVLRAPRSAWPLAWESSDRLVLADGGDLDAPWLRLVRCWVTDGHCEQAGPPLHHAHLPDPLGF
jgi:hypothetical protein